MKIGNPIKMFPDLEKVLSTRYPEFFRNLHGGIACGAGWHGIIETLCERLMPLAPPSFHFIQIKEKFGTLCFYPHVDSFEVNDEDLTRILNEIDRATEESERTCEDCSSTNVTVKTKGPCIRTLCLTCENSYHHTESTWAPSI
jgi:hypothetical protein